jgi:cytochrome c peroxidase
MRKLGIATWCGLLIGITAMTCFAVGTWSGNADAQSKAKIEELGKRVFFDNISVPERMSCATCHDPKAGGTLKNSGTNLHQVGVTGANPHTVGGLKPPTNAYASFIPKFQPCAAGFFGYCGGNFWNGRSEGNDSPLFAGAAPHVGNEVFEIGGAIDPALEAAYKAYLGPVADQALNPFGNPVEQNIDRIGVCLDVASAKYAPLFELVWKEPIRCTSAADVDMSFKRLAVSLSAWQASAEVNSFSSKRDNALAADPDKKFPLAGFTAQENLGHDLFYNTLPIPFLPEGTPPVNVRPFPNLPVTNCSFCHLSSTVARDGTDPVERYTDDAYHNIGTPFNPEIAGSPNPNPLLASHTGALDPGAIPGTGTFLPLGYVKTPTLRNVDKRPGKGFTKAYAHNGWFKSLESIVHFYNTANVNPVGSKLHTVTRCPEGAETEKDALALNCWPAPEYPDVPGLAIGAIFGNLGLTPEEEAAIVAYLKTFTDTYTAKQPAPYK